MFIRVCLFAKRNWPNLCVFSLPWFDIYWARASISSGTEVGKRLFEGKGAEVLGDHKILEQGVPQRSRLLDHLRR